MMHKILKRTALILASALLLLAAWAALSWPREQFIPASSAAAYAPTADNLARGAYLARAGDCMACHTTRGGVQYAGGRAIQTPFGAIVSPNITPDAATGIGAWSADDFWRALHHGVSRDGRLLYPAFPYPNYTKVTRPDADALYAFLRSLPPVRQPNASHSLRFPYNTQAALAGWRLLYFKPGVFNPTTTQPAAWNRGAYLVEGLGHCSACHSARNATGGSATALAGGLIPMLDWYAPSLTADDEAGLGNWQVGDIVSLLHTGVSPRATVFGPMAEVVGRSLQHLDEADVTAMAVYLKALPPTPSARASVEQSPQLAQVIAQGKQIYGAHCIDCHGADGKGLPPHYPPLAGNRALTMASAVNPIRMALNGGFAPATNGNPRPYSMPPYSHILNDAEVAAVVTYLRNSWGNQAPPVPSNEVNRYRATPGQD